MEIGLKVGETDKFGSLKSKNLLHCVLRRK